MKSHKDIIAQYYPDGNLINLKLYNENKVIRMIEQAVKIDRMKTSRFTTDDILNFARFHGVNCDIQDLIRWINETT